jgi:hypothetical protein
MQLSELRAAAVPLDPTTVAFYLRVPRSHVVLLQAYFELYDGVGTVRTTQGSEPVLCVLTPTSQQEDCMNVLAAIRGEVHWEVAPQPASEQNHPIISASKCDDPTDK